MWRTERERVGSARARLAQAGRLWGWSPHQRQREWFVSPAPVRVAACGRRWGKTESLSVDIATLALAAPGTRQLVVAPTDAQARLLGEDIWARLGKVLDGSQAEMTGKTLAVRARPSLVMTITDKDGQVSEILCRTAGRDGRNLRGLWAHRIVVDEAAFVPDRVLREVLPPMLADRGGEWTLASSPNGRQGAFYGLYARGARPHTNGLRHESFQCATSDNTHLDKAWLKSQEQDMSPELFAQEFGAQFLDSFGAVFRDEDIDAAITDLPGVRLERAGADSEARAGRHYVMGIDWGRKMDYSVVIVLDAEESPAKLVHLSRWRGTGWLPQAEAAAALAARFRPRRLVADGTSLGDPLAALLTEAIARQLPPGAGRPLVEQFHFSAETKQALIDRLTVGMAGRALQFPPHGALLDELRGFEYAPGGKQGHLKMAARGSGHDDCVVALALAYWAVPAPGMSQADFGILLGSSLGRGRE